MCPIAADVACSVVCVCLCISVCWARVNCTKMAKSFEMPFGWLTRGSWEGVIFEVFWPNEKHCESLLWCMQQKGSMTS